MRELADEVARAIGVAAHVRYCPLPADDPQQRRPDLTRAKGLLGWSPTVQLAEGLERTVAYFRESPAAKTDEPRMLRAEGA